MYARTSEHVLFRVKVRVAGTQNRVLTATQLLNPSRLSHGCPFGDHCTAIDLKVMLLN